MKLRELLATLSQEISLSDHPSLDAEVTGLSTNSHACNPGDLFIGMPGTRVDGGEFWPGAIAAGALGALISPQAALKQPPTLAPRPPCIIPLANMPQVCAQVAAAFYGYPARHLQLVGVTGTNGKTTTTHLIEFLLNQAQQPTALLGTLYSRWPGYEQVTAHTTPFAVDLQRELGRAVEAGCQFAVLEVSSHALAQRRVLGCPFQVAAFTNLTQDHLDYHQDMDDYFAAKALLFGPDYLQGQAIVNWDDPYGQQLVEQLKADRVWRYSLHDPVAELHARDLSYGADGVRGQLQTPAGQVEFYSPLVGQFNLANVLAAVGVCLQLGLELPSIAETLATFPGVPGRMERVQIDTDDDISVIVDYAHTPDSLENLLRAARPFIKGQVICVFGCGGDRDRTKRPQMGRIAAELADAVAITSDNPRTEDPEQILQEIVAGIPDSNNRRAKSVTVVCDRAQAIRTAIQQAQTGDGVLIAGKGHEDYQILGTEKIHFDDREQARAALAARNSSGHNIS